MKAPRLFAPMTMFIIVLTSFDLLAVDLRANDPLPPVPPGNALPPPQPAAAPPAPPPTPAAQPLLPGTGAQNGARHPRFQKLKNELNLTPAQIARIRPIVQNTRQQVEALRANTTMPQQQKRQQLRQIRTSSFQQIRPLLTPQQLQRWKEIRAAQRAGQKI